MTSKTNRSGDVLSSLRSRRCIHTLKKTTHTHRITSLSWVHSLRASPAGVWMQSAARRWYYHAIFAALFLFVFVVLSHLIMIFFKHLSHPSLQRSFTADTKTPDEVRVQSQCSSRSVALALACGGQSVKPSSLARSPQLFRRPPLLLLHYIFTVWMCSLSAQAVPASLLLLLSISFFFFFLFPPRLRNWKQYKSVSSLHCLACALF